MGRYRAGIRTSADITGGRAGGSKGGDTLGEGGAGPPGMDRSTTMEHDVLESHDGKHDVLRHKAEGKGGARGHGLVYSSICTLPLQREHSPDTRH